MTPDVTPLRREMLLKQIDYLRASMAWFEAEFEGKGKTLICADIRHTIQAAGQELGGRHPQLDTRIPATFQPEGVVNIVEDGDEGC
jgi:hypothetical protein